MKKIIYILSFIVSLYLFACEKECKISEARENQIKSEITEMTSQFFSALDSNHVDQAMQYIDTSATFILVPFLDGSLKISREDIVKAYRNITTLKSNWQKIEIDPLMNNLAYCQGSFKQVFTDSTGKSQNMFGKISALIKYQNNIWKFYKGQIYIDD
jgi:hypothetical protein